MMRIAFPCLCLAAASLNAQNYLLLPSTANPVSELPNYSIAPLMEPNARMQLFYDATEVGTPLPFTADEIALRYDGPLPQVGAPGPFTITRLLIRIGVTSVAVPNADFAANLTQPLTTVFDSQVTYYPDPGSVSVHPWGGPNGTLTFPFSAPAPLAVAPGQWLVIDLQMWGNNISQFGFAHAMLDGANAGGGPINGSTLHYGQGCSATATGPAATASVSGICAPGAAHFLGGSNLGANAFALGVFGLSDTTAFVPLPFTLPGTACSLLVSPDVTFATVTDASGAIPATQTIPLSLAADPAFAGMLIFEQVASLVPAANPWGIVLSDAVAVTLGTWTPAGRGTWTVQHDSDADASFGNAVKAFGLALRLHTL